VTADRHSIAQQQELITDPDERARREVENGFRQLSLATDIIREHVQDADRPFRLAPRHLLQLNHAALDGIHMLAGTYRNGPVRIGGSRHEPPAAYIVPEEVAGLCDYVNSQWDRQEALHLCAYTLWRINWIHPFADGNGRTARAAAYVALSIRLNGLLPGSPTIPDQIASDKRPYYDALEAADAAWLNSGQIELSVMEGMLQGMLAKQLLSVFPAGTQPSLG
jgi:Fic family protein